MTLDYRKEIDGLRALAIIPVIFFHADFEVFNKGFVGVDIFFALSGFLITTLLLEEKRMVSCPNCKSTKTVVVSQFGSTACKALFKCEDCKEPFDYFKCH